MYIWVICAPKALIVDLHVYSAMGYVQWCSRKFSLVGTLAWHYDREGGGARMNYQGYKSMFKHGEEF